jgi:acyl-CoA dehydrogenase
MVPAAAAGFSVDHIEEKTGQRACPVAQLSFHDVFVPAVNRLGREGAGWPLAMYALVFGRGAVAAVAVGIAQHAYDVALEHARTRWQGGQPIILHQSVRAMLADMRTAVEAARLMARSACWVMDREIPPPVPPSAMAKTFASDVAMKVAVDAVQIVGGRGYMRGHPAERLMRDAKVTQIYEGTNQLLRLLAMQDEIDAMAPHGSGGGVRRRGSSTETVLT